MSVRGRATSVALATGSAIAALARDKRQRPFDPNAPIVRDLSNNEYILFNERTKARKKTYSGSGAVIHQWGPGGFSDEVSIEGSTGKTSVRWSITGWWG